MTIAFIVTPWASIRILRWGKKYSQLTAGIAPALATSHFAHEEEFFTRLYRRVMGPMIAEKRGRWLFLASITALLLGAMATVGFGWVKLKMLPFDNKSEFQVIMNLPEGSSLERTAQVRPRIAGIAARYDARVAVAEVPPGPPVLPVLYFMANRRSVPETATAA